MTILERLLRHDAWTTRALLELSAGLSDAELDQEFDIGHRTLRKTFVHILDNMEGWYDAVSASASSRPSRESTGASIPILIDRLDVVARELLAFGTRVDAEELEEADFVDGKKRKPIGAGLVHLCTHGMHHRAHCLYMMRRLGVPNLIEGDALSCERIYRGLQSWPDA